MDDREHATSSQKIKDLEIGYSGSGEQQLNSTDSKSTTLPSWRLKTCTSGRQVKRSRSSCTILRIKVADDLVFDRRCVELLEKSVSAILADGSQAAYMISCSPTFR